MKSLIVVLTLLTLLSLLVAAPVGAKGPHKYCATLNDRVLYLEVLSVRLPNTPPALRLDQQLGVQAMHEVRRSAHPANVLVVSGTYDPIEAMQLFRADPQNVVRMTDLAYTGVGIAQYKDRWAIVLGQFTGWAVYAGVGDRCPA